MTLKRDNLLCAGKKAIELASTNCRTA